MSQKCLAWPTVMCSSLAQRGLPPEDRITDPVVEIHVQVDTDEAEDSFRVCLVRFGGTTHGNHMDQRFIWLEISQTEMVQYGVPPWGTLPDAMAPDPGDRRWRLHFDVPSNPSLLPPGQYMLFVLNKYNVPSIGKFVFIDGSEGVGGMGHR